MNRKYFYLIIISLIIASGISFSPIAGNEFINFDDNLYITENNYIESGLSLENIKWALTAVVVSNWHPLTLLSHMLDWSTFGNYAGGHHLVSLFLHISTVILLFLFLYKTTHNIWPAAFAAAFFALHPLRVESVAWASERKDVLSLFFGMASIYAYAFYAQKNKRSMYFLCLFLFILSLMSKPMLVTLPFVLLLLDYWPLNRWQQTPNTPAGNSLKPAGKLILEKIPFVLISIASSIITLWAQNKSGALVKTESIPFDARFSNAIFSYIAYLEKIFWPADLAVYYPYEMSLPFWKVLIAGLVILFMSVAVLHYIRKIPFLFVGWFWYLGTLIPVIGLVQVGSQAMADRYTYLPSIGIGIALAWGIASLIKSESIRKSVVWPTAIAILAIWVVLTVQQCGYWKNSVMLFRHALKVTKNNDKMHHNLGTHFYKEGKFREALDQFSHAIKINSNYLSLNSRGVIYAQAGMYQRALSDFNKSISLMPNNINGYYNRGLTYNKTGEYQLAIGDFNKVINLKNDYVDAYNNRGIIYMKSGQYQSAIEDFSKAISLQPGHVYAYSNRASAYFAQGNNEPGCRDAKKACTAGKCEPLKKAQAEGLCH